MLAKLRNEARELVRNNGHAGRIVDIWTSNIVGTGIVPRFRTGSADLDRRAQDLWRRWCDRADADGRTDFYGLQALAVRSMVESGESLARQRLRRAADGLPVPLQIQLLEADYLDVTRDRPIGPRVTGGVQFDAIGGRAAYHLFSEHPGAPLGTSWQSKPVPADEIAHLYKRERPGQIRGVPWLARSMLRLRELQEWSDATLVKAKTEACLGLIVTRPPGGGSPIGRTTTDADGKRIETLEPAMVAYLQPGEEVTTLQPSSNSSYEPFAIHHEMEAAVGAGLTYDQMTGNLRQANYSSLRAGKIEQRRLVEQIQWQVVIPQLCVPAMDWFLAAAQAAGALPVEQDYRVDWVPPRHESLDPLKDINADIAAVRGGFEPLPEVTARYGYDWRDVLAQAAEVAEAVEAAGLALDTDLRRQPPAVAPAKPEKPKP